MFYRYDGTKVFVLYVMRGERSLRKDWINKRDRGSRDH